MDNALLTHDENFRTSYLVLLTSVATANHKNTQEEVAFMQQMCQAAQLPQAGVQQVIKAMQSPSTALFAEHAQALKGDDLRFSLVADIINLAYADGNVDADELQQIKNVNGAMNITDEQFETLNAYVQQANTAAAQQEGSPSGGNNGFLAKSGLEGKFSQANIPGDNFQSGSTIGSVLSNLAANFLQGQVGGGNQQQANSGGGLDLGNIAGSLIGGMMNNNKGGSGQQQGGLGGMIGNILSSDQGKAAIGGLISHALSGNEKGKGLTNLAALLGGGGNKNNQQNAGGGLGNIIGGLLGAL
jgi:uncharacterized tellurite resistance protein B-like protein